MRRHLDACCHPHYNTWDLRWILGHEMTITTEFFRHAQAVSVVPKTQLNPGDFFRADRTEKWTGKITATQLWKPLRFVQFQTTHGC